MEQWGAATCDCDSVHDYLQDIRLDPTRFDQVDADKGLTNVWKEERYGTNYGKLGVVFLLNHDLIVTNDKLKQVLEFANTELDRERLSDWKDNDERIQMIKKEIKNIKSAIKRGGYHA